MQNFCVLLAFLLFTVALLIAISIYCYLMKYQAKQKHLLPFHDNNELKQIIYEEHKSEMSNKVKDIDTKKTHILLF